MKVSIDEVETMGAPLRVGTRPYPYLVIRWMAAAYGTATIQVVGLDDELASREGLRIIDPDHQPHLGMTTSLRRKIIDAALAESMKRRLRMCVVFAVDEAVYVEPDGRWFQAADPPRGGLRLDNIDAGRR